MAKTTFRGVSIRHADLRMKDGVLFSRLHLTAELTVPVAAEQGWQTALETDGWSSMKLEGLIRLLGIRMEVSGLKQILQMKAEEARDFEAVRATNPETKATKVELRFLVVTTDHPSLYYEYWNSVGDAEGQLVATLQEEAVQEKLPLSKPAA